MRWHLASAILATCTVLACSVARPETAAAPTWCEPGDTALVRDVIYFGRDRPGGGTVSDEDWKLFLDSIVTPRFPDGLTVVEASGQWRGQPGTIEHERSMVMPILHGGDASARSAIAAIANEYKRRFRQESVMRERAHSCVRF